MRWNMVVLTLVVSCSSPAMGQMSVEDRSAAHNSLGGVKACESCHGELGYSRNSSVPALNGQQPDYIVSRVGQLLELPSKPTGSALSGLVAESETQALAVIAGYFARQKPTARKPGSLAEAGRRIYENGIPARFVTACKSCHGANGEGHGAVPRLAGQHANYLALQLRMFSSGVRENRLMHFNTLDLGDDDIDALVSYLAGD
jgi:cytochrome c553